MERKNKNKIIYGETFAEQAPRPNPAVFDVLSEYIASEGDRRDELFESLNDVYKMFSSLDSQFVFSLNKLEKDAIITRNESLILLIIITVSIELDPDLSNLRQAILDRSVRGVDLLKLEKDTIMLNKDISNKLFAIISNIKNK